MRVSLETGHVAITDVDGRYHLAGLAARVPDGTVGGRLLPGRHRIKLDSRALPGGSAVAPSSATIELPMGAIAAQDFAVSSRRSVTATVELAYSQHPPSATLKGEAVVFLATGRAGPKDHVTVSDVAATVEPDGSWHASIPLGVGANDVPITVESADGVTQLFVQRFDVVDRQSSYLVIPRGLEPTATVVLPGNVEKAAPAGKTSVRVQGMPGTRVKGPESEVLIGESGVAQLPVTLAPGENTLELTLNRPGQPSRTQSLKVSAAYEAFVVALADVELTYDVKRSGVRLFGRGGAHAEWHAGPWLLEGELELRDTDVTDYQRAGSSSLFAPRRVDRFERVLDPERYPNAFGDESITLTPNPEESKLRVEVRHEQFGAIGFGTRRALFQDSEVGRYQRALFGPWAELKSPALGPLQLSANGFFAPGISDPVRALATSPAHEEFRATGGSLFYLGATGVAQGSEILRVEYRDGITGLPLGEQHLQRGRDYEIDYLSGRVLLARPLSFVDSSGMLVSQPFAESLDRVLVADYEAVQFTEGGRRTLGGEAGAEVGPVSLSFGAVQERGGGAERFDLLRARASAPVGPLTLLLEAAQSRGLSTSPSLFGLSYDGGLSFSRPWDAAADASGQALGIRARGKALFGLGRVDAAFRYRSAGFSDGAHIDVGAERRMTLLAEQPVKNFRLGVLLDDRKVTGPVGAYRTDLSELTVRDARNLGGYVGYHFDKLDLRAEGRSVSMDVEEESGVVSGSRFDVGGQVRYQVTNWLAVVGSHHQALSRSGDGPGAFDDTLSLAGADFAISNDAELGVRGGWGPELGPVAFASGSLRRGNDLHYGSYSVDVDGPDIGERKMVSGVRSEVYEGGSVFVEDVAAHDAASLRLSRAAGLNVEPVSGLQLSARYERGLRQPWELPESRTRDAGALSATFVRERLRLFGRAELRAERDPDADSELTVQRVLSGAGELRITDAVRFSGRINFADTYEGVARRARLLEATTGLSWRGALGAVVLQYSVTREQQPPSKSDAGERGFQAVSLLPALRVSDRFTLYSGFHVGQAFEGGNSSLVLSGSLRPAVRVVGGLELAAEVGMRTITPLAQSSELHTVRGEVGYRFNESMLMAAGYTVFGYQGTGISSLPSDSRDRAYLRAELGY